MPKNNQKASKPLDIDAEFTDIIRERMTEDQFWSWVRGWYDSETICDLAEEWDESDKLQLINNFNNGIYNTR